MRAEHRSKFATLNRQWWRLHMSEKFSSGKKTPKQTNNIQGSVTFSALYRYKEFNWMPSTRVVLQISLRIKSKVVGVVVVSVIWFTMFTILSVPTTSTHMFIHTCTLY